MAIEIKMYDNRWRLAIKEEVWEFSNIDELLGVTRVLLGLKEECGKLKKV